MPLLTVGHGTLDRPALTSLLTGFAVDHIVDVRRFPGSRRNPDVKREALADWLPAAGISYRWEQRLGGRRHLRKAEDAASPDTWWRVDAFRAYAGYTRSDEFGEGLADLLAEASQARVAVMCSETVWWRCHRRLIADVVTLTAGVPVHHLMPDGSERPHEPAAGARLAGGVVVWDGSA